MALADQLNEYLDYLEYDRRVTKATLKNYRSTLKRFVTFCKESRRPFGSAAVKDFLRMSQHASSRNVLHTRIAGFARFAGVELKNVPKAIEEVRQAEALTSDEVHLLVRAAMSVSLTLGSSVIFLSETGLRFEEFLNVKPSDVRSVGDGHMLAVFGKGRKHRDVPLSPAAFQALPNLPSDMDRSAQDQFRADLAAAGIAAGLRMHVHPHLLRGSFISTAINEHHIDSILVARIVGHSSVDTMMKHYYRESASRLCEAVARPSVYTQAA